MSQPQLNPCHSFPVQSPYRSALPKLTEHDFATIARTELFAELSSDEIQAILPCLGATCRSLSPNEILFLEGEPTRQLAIVLEGALRVEGSDVWGNSFIMGAFTSGELVAEAYAVLGTAPLLASVIAQTSTRVLLIYADAISQRCSSLCSFHDTLDQRLLHIVAHKNLMLSQRISDSAPKSLRAKLLAYLSTQSKHADSTTFSIPFSRQQLADYLGVDRSALCTVITSLRHEGILEAHGKRFTLIQR